MAKLTIINKNIDDLKIYDNNPRRNEKAVKSVSNSLKKFGYTNPIIINKDNVILAGHTRLAAMKKNGILEAECIQLSHLSPEEESAFRLADNRAHDFSSWDGDLLEMEMRGIEADDWKEFGFTDSVLKRLQPPETCTCLKCGRQFLRV